MPALLTATPLSHQFANLGDVNLHYVTERRDTPFWKHVAENCIGENTKARLKHWQHTMPSRNDFAPLPGHFAHTEQQLHYPVLDGLGLLNRDVAQKQMNAVPDLKKKARVIADGLTKEYREAAPQAIPHRMFLEGLT